MLLVPIIFSLLQAADPSSAAWKERHFPSMPNVPECSFTKPFRQVGSMADLPEQVRAELVGFFAGSGGLADANGEFNSTDVAENKRVPRARFVRAYLTEDVWFIWWESGGVGRGLNTLALKQGRGKGSEVEAYHAEPGSIFTGDLCAGSKAFLAGARAAPGF
jgi:hypothetical protein